MVRSRIVTVLPNASAEAACLDRLPKSCPVSGASMPHSRDASLRLLRRQDRDSIAVGDADDAGGEVRRVAGAGRDKDDHEEGVLHEVESIVIVSGRPWSASNPSEAQDVGGQVA